jgi:hypothetical protein
MALIFASGRNIAVGDVEHRIARDERGCVTVWTKTKMHEVEDDGRASNSPKILRVAFRAGGEIGHRDWHRKDLLGLDTRVRQQTFAEVGEVSVRMTVRRDTLINLGNVYHVPRNSFVSEVAKHLPGCSAAAHCEHELSTGADSCAGGVRNNRGSSTGGGIGIGKDVDIHGFLDVGW